MQLRPYQVEALKRLLERPNKRLYAAHAPGAGKTRLAIEAMQFMRAKCVLVVCPATARPVWRSELAKWAFNSYYPESAAIIYGRERKLSKPKSKLRDVAYTHPVQIVSYTLMGEVSATGWDLLVFDEAHRLGDPGSEQSTRARKLFAANPQAAALFLSGTPIPTEPSQVWQVADLCEPGWCGKLSPRGEVPFAFRRQFCAAIPNEYAHTGFVYKGSGGPEAMERLRAKLAPLMHVVTDDQVSEFAPPIQLRAIRADETVNYPRYAAEWMLDAREASSHQVIVCFLRETASDIALKLGAPLVTGALTPEERSQVIARHRETGGPLVATSESIKESISLSHAKRALILQARTSPGQALQLLKRFARQDSESQAVTNIDYLIELGDSQKSELLIERLNAVQVAIGESKSATALGEVMRPEPMTAERITSLLGSMLDGMLDSDIEDDDFEDDD